MGQRGYKQLTARDRVLISKLRSKKLTITEIARQIGKDKSTVSRELRRNAIELTPQDRFFLHRIERLWSEDDLDEYLKTRPPEDRLTKTVWIHAEAHTQCGLRAWRASQKRRRKKPATRKWVVAKLRGGWSPQQIAGRSKVDGPESVSHEYVYALLHRDKKRGGTLYRLLKRFGKRKQRLSARAYRKPCAAADRPSIEDRPAIVDKRARLGDYEADLIVGYRQSGYVLSVIDRRSRATVLRRVQTKRMHTVRRQIQFALRQLGGARTLTVDNGKEFFAHKQLERDANVRVFFTHPYCSTERASIENLNGLVRYYLPKRSSFAALSQGRLNEIQDLLNHRPRRCLGYLTPHEVHFRNFKLRA
jgi:IS30 family transposase